MRWRSTAATIASAKLGVVGDEDGLRGFVVLGLREQIGRDPVGIGGLVGEDQHFRRAGDHVDADLAEDAALGRRHPGVAGADDLGDGREWSSCHRPAPPRPARRRRDRFRRCRSACAAASTSGSTWPPGVGTTMTMRFTPATFAGTTFISTEEG